LQASEQAVSSMRCQTLCLALGATFLWVHAHTAYPFESARRNGHVLHTEDRAAPRTAQPAGNVARTGLRHGAGVHGLHTLMSDPPAPSRSAGFAWQILPVA